MRKDKLSFIERFAAMFGFYKRVNNEPEAIITASSLADSVNSNVNIAKMEYKLKLDKTVNKIKKLIIAKMYKMNHENKSIYMEDIELPNGIDKTLDIVDVIEDIQKKLKETTEFRKVKVINNVWHERGCGDYNHYIDVTMYL